MGVRGLHSFVEGKLPAAQHTIPLAAVRALSGGDCIVVDGMALIRRLYSAELDWVGGGQFQELFIKVAPACPGQRH